MAARSSVRLTPEQRHRLGALLAGPRKDDRRAAARLAEGAGVSASWLRTLRRRVQRDKWLGRPGRPPVPATERARVRALLEAERERQGRTAGAPALGRALTAAGHRFSRMVLEQELAALKAAQRRVARQAHEARRQGLEVHHRDTVWGEDTTHLGRLADGTKVEGEVLKDLATRETVGVSVGGVPTARDVLELLEQAAGERGGWPLVWMADRGAINREGALAARLTQERVVHLLSRPHTPTDNAATERQHRDLKEEAGLGKGTAVCCVEHAAAAVRAARQRLDEHRLRATLGWRTAAQVGHTLPRGDGAVDRDAFYGAATRAMQAAEDGLRTERARARARRKAVFDTLARFGLATRPVGPRPRVRPGPGACNAPAAGVQCPGAGGAGP